VIAVLFPILGCIVGRQLVHHAILRDILRYMPRRAHLCPSIVDQTACDRSIKMFQKREKGTWLIMALTTIVVTYIGEAAAVNAGPTRLTGGLAGGKIYNAIVDGSYSQEGDIKVTSFIPATGEEYQNVAAMATFIADYVTAFMVRPVHVTAVGGPLTVPWMHTHR
jgi:hypothetical protein